jgi:hypothetical protein
MEIDEAIEGLALVKSALSSHQVVASVIGKVMLILADGFVWAS